MRLHLPAYLGSDPGNSVLQDIERISTGLDSVYRPVERPDSRAERPLETDVVEVEFVGNPESANDHLR